MSSPHGSPACAAPDLLLADPDPDVRIGAVLALAGLPGDEAADLLAQVVLHDPHASVVAAAIGGLAAMTGHRCEPILCAARDRFPIEQAITYAVTRALSVMDRERT